MTEQRIILNAPAKINLTLEVLKKRTDGYHDLRTVMHSIDVCDTVTVELSEANDGGIIVECTTPLPPVNTAFTAARLFREKTFRPKRVSAAQVRMLRRCFTACSSFSAA